MKVYLNNPKDPKNKDSKNFPRLIVEAKIVREFPSYYIVELPDGNKIKRKKKRDIVQETTKEK